MLINKKSAATTIVCLGILIIAQSFQQKSHDEKPVNLQVLPKNTTGEELHKIMRGYSMSLGVRCNYCHVSHDVEGQEKPRFDFRADDKKEKNIARDMMRMVDAINNTYMSKIPQNGHVWEQVTCVTCHNGRTVPLVSVDSLAKRESH